jgi:hypothetical protein
VSEGLATQRGAVAVELDASLMGQALSAALEDWYQEPAGLTARAGRYTRSSPRTAGRSIPSIHGFLAVGALRPSAIACQEIVAGLLRRVRSAPHGLCATPADRRADQKAAP